jgi:hypothetical protein
MAPNPYESPTHSGNSLPPASDATPPPGRFTVIEVLVLCPIVGTALFQFLPAHRPPPPPLWIGMLIMAVFITGTFIISVGILCLIAKVVAICARKTASKRGRSEDVRGM